MSDEIRCLRCHHPLDEHNARRCTHLHGTAELCRCWVGFEGVLMKLVWREHELRQGLRGAP